MPGTFASDLSSIKPEIWLDLFYQGLAGSRFVTQMATRHDVSGAGTIHFPVINSLTAVSPATDDLATVYEVIDPDDNSVDPKPIYAAVSLGRFAQSTSQVKALDVAGAAMAALADELERLLFAEAVAGPADSVGSNAVPFDSALMLAARGKLGANSQNMAGWVIDANQEGDMLADTDLFNAITLANSILVDGRVARVMGAPVFVTDHPIVSGGASHGALVGRGTLHYAVSQNPSFEIVYDPDARADKIVAEAHVGVKYIALEKSIGVELISNDNV